MKRTVVVRIPNWLGDAVMARPVIEAIANSGDDLIVAGGGVFAPLFEDVRFLPLRSSWDWKTLEEAGADRILLLTNSFSTAFSARRAGIRERIGYAMHLRSPLLTHAIRYRKSVHQIEKYLKISRVGGYEGAPDVVPRLFCKRPSSESGSYIVVAPGAQYGSAKRWENFGELCRRLCDEEKKVVVVGLPSECRGIVLPRRPELVDLIGKTSMSDLLSILGGATAVISNDSGIAHCARALDRPTLVLFGPTDPAATLAPGADVMVGKVPCAPCHLRVCPIDHRCMKAIRLDAVLGYIRNRWKS